MPKYAKFLKEILSNKMKLTEFETIALSEECSAIVLNKLPPKLKDLGSFTILCTIGDSHFEKALCDLGANINLMPFFVFRKLGMKEPKSTTISLQLVDHSIIYPRGVYRWFIKDFAKISKPLTDLLVKDVNFVFDDNYMKAFNTLKEKLATAPVVVAPDWSCTFELMCDASDVAVGAVLGQKRDKVFRVIYYASKTLDEAQRNYTTTEKKLLAVLYAFDKFKPYLLMSKIIVYTDHSAIKYLLAKQDVKP